MRVDVLVAEIGSTTTVVNAFTHLATASPCFVGQGVAATSVLASDVTIGLRAAITDLDHQLGDPVQWQEMLATSSAAGGLRMSVHGLVYDMTVRAAREAALGAGAIVKMVTAGPLTAQNLAGLECLKPNIILLAGGVDHGEKDTVLDNARQLASLALSAPVVYAGNVAAADEVQAIFAKNNVQIEIVENVYPRIDELNVEPTRKAIQQVFERHIVDAPGMQTIRGLVNGPILPTPGAVMAAAKLLQPEIGDLLVFDVGGATTDVHSVTVGSEEISRLMVSPEPLAKRTVEGDLGVYINASHVAERIGWDQLSEAVGGDAANILANWLPIPAGQMEFTLLEELTREAVRTALSRHVGHLRQLYGPTGRTTIAEGKDLTNVRYLIGTGGPLTKLASGKAILQSLIDQPNRQELLPKSTARVLIDHNYNLAVLGALAERYPQAALALLCESLHLAD